ncbi:MAG: plasmid recombination protein [Lachnospiraceae bacterium]|nr:plasmid recombination protein [Lachnospiraceae bacterium]
MHIIKLHSSDCKSVLEEASRNHKSKVGTIDESRTHLNYSLAPEANRVTDANSIKERIKALGVTRKIRDDAVLSCSCIITLPTDYKGDTEAFMRSAYKALTETLCKGNEDRVIQAEVHMDEKTPHMHFAFIPITEKVNKKGKPTIALDAKNLLNKTFMREFHPLTEKLISEDLKMPVKLYDEEKCKERAEKHSRGDFSADYEDIEEFKARKSKETAKKKLENDLEDITLTIGGKELELCEINGLLEEKDKELDEKDKIIAEKIAENEKISKENEDLVAKIEENRKEAEKGKEIVDKLETQYKATKSELKLLNDEKTLLETVLIPLMTRFTELCIKATEIMNRIPTIKASQMRKEIVFGQNAMKSIENAKSKNFNDKSILQPIKDLKMTNNSLENMIMENEEDEDYGLD